MSITVSPSATNAGLTRIDGPAKVTGTAAYAFEQPVESPLYLHPVQATIARGSVRSIDTSRASSLSGVVDVMTHENAPRLADASDAEYAILQGPEIGFRGQFLAAVVADTPEIARHAAGLVTVDYEVSEHDAELRWDHPELYAPEQVNAGKATDTATGDADAVLEQAAVKLDRMYSTPWENNNPMEPHTTIALWNDEGLTLYESTQGVHPVRMAIAPVFGLPPDDVHVIAPHVGGGFGSKGLPHANLVLTALAAQRLRGRAVKFALTRQQMFSVAGYRSPTIQRVQLGADPSGRLAALAVDVVVQTSRIKEFVEQAASPARMMYAAEHRRTSHRVAALDVPIPSWMRAPGECPGMFGLEVAMDELAEELGLDPIELRERNEPEIDPETGKPFANRRLLDCFRLGAERFGWDRRNSRPGSRWEGRRRLGIGVASATYPYMRQRASSARIRYEGEGVYAVHIGAADLGTGTWTTLTQIAAECLDVGVEQIRLQIGDSSLPMATVAGGSSGTASWGSAILAAAGRFREEHGTAPEAGAEVRVRSPRQLETEGLSMHSFGAHFAEVSVDADTGEIRVDRLLGVFSAGRIINPRTARSQFLGGMTMGLGMALHEQSVMDPRFGIVVNHDLAEYHVPTNADVRDMEAVWLDEFDEHVGPLGARGIGEIGIVGTAAAIANAACNATGIRVRDLPITPDKLLG
ncbi:xanthine dehydrogenase family protein molybdopterin-binding subunit [Brevibacterium daeguense]|uniref:Xanthine dehydrogenase family protein molybdopterin-binding subunit n=1 Tax=Brevibacterium daeguense TaxID=909936 RepID=A0ABP8EK28_9MICO|nr:xanthine dehydrogenase family protein molybdopterin-binding subunit [Brevibacterium daeguense]